MDMENMDHKLNICYLLSDEEKTSILNRTMLVTFTCSVKLKREKDMIWNETGYKFKAKIYRHFKKEVIYLLRVCWQSV